MEKKSTVKEKLKYKEEIFGFAKCKFSSFQNYLDPSPLLRMLCKLSSCHGPGRLWGNTPEDKEDE